MGERNHQLLRLHQPRQGRRLGNVHPAAYHALKRPRPAREIMGKEAAQIKADIRL